MFVTPHTTIPTLTTGILAWLCRYRRRENGMRSFLLDMNFQGCTWSEVVHLDDAFLIMVSLDTATKL